MRCSITRSPRTEPTTARRLYEIDNESLSRLIIPKSAVNGDRRPLSSSTLCSLCRTFPSNGCRGLWPGSTITIRLRVSMHLYKCAIANSAPSMEKKQSNERCMLRISFSNPIYSKRFSLRIEIRNLTMILRGMR